jgi:hypothetical protein
VLFLKPVLLSSSILNGVEESSSNLCKKGSLQNVTFHDSNKYINDVPFTLNAPEGHAIALLGVDEQFILAVVVELHA